MFFFPFFELQRWNTGSRWRLIILHYEWARRLMDWSWLKASGLCGRIGRPHEIPRCRISQIILNTLYFFTYITSNTRIYVQQDVNAENWNPLLPNCIRIDSRKNLRDGKAIFRKFDRFLSLDSRPGFPEQQLNTGWILKWSGTHPEETAINNREHIRAYGPYYLSGQSCGDNVTGTGWRSHVQLSIHRSAPWY